MALSRKHFSFRIRLQQFYAPYGRSNAKESLNWPKRDYFYGSHWSLPPKGNESQNKWSNENTGTPSYAEWTPELKNRKGWYTKSVCWWLMNYSTLLLVFPVILAKVIFSSIEFKWFYIHLYFSTSIYQVKFYNFLTLSSAKILCKSNFLFCWPMLVPSSKVMRLTEILTSERRSQLLTHPESSPTTIRNKTQCIIIAKIFLAPIMHPKMCEKFGFINFDIEAKLNKLLHFCPTCAKATNEQNAANNTLVLKGSSPLRLW